MIDFKINTVSLGDESYPLLLGETKNPPIKLFYRGTLPFNDEPMIAIVGTRKASEEGKATATLLAEDLSKNGFTIVSGLAMGIDSSAHRGALKSGGRTIAVVANGLESVYPVLNERLASEILESGGCLMSEYPPSDPPYPSRFLERNRIIAGLSVATVVIEAPEKSGSLVTAKFSAEEGRGVFVIPGGARDKNYRGSHFLIRTGARLASNAGEIMEDLADDIRNLGLKLKGLEQKRLLLDDSEALIFLALEKSSYPLTIDNLVEITHLETHIIIERITFLSLSGFIEEKEGKFFIKNK